MPDTRTAQLREAYTPNIYQAMAGPARAAAAVVVPIVRDLVPTTSVIDLGCGTGEWLAVFREHGSSRVTGVVGPCVDRKALHIAREEFVEHDLALPFVLPQRFDLAVCLEVVGHIPDERADVVVESLCALSDVVLFSAPIPLQHPVGTHPANNQWPEYWAERFRRRGYQPIDAIRWRIWDNPVVPYYYSQNILLYASGSALRAQPRLADACERWQGKALPLVHPALYVERAAIRDPGFRGRLRVVGELPAAFVRACRNALRRNADHAR